MSAFATIIHRDLTIHLSDDATLVLTDPETTITVRRTSGVTVAEATKPDPVIGAPFAGGFFAGRDMDDPRYAIVVAPKADGQKNDVTWREAIDFCASVRAGGFDDWRAPTKEGLYVVYRGFGPNVTEAAAFKLGQPEAFDPRWYWTSTGYGSGFAWYQFFVDGRQACGDEDSGLRVRAVRKVLI
jgi:hypothetical protein